MAYPRPNAVSTALLVSSCTKLFPLLMMIWEYDVPAAAKSVGWAVVVNNVEALRILLGVGYVPAGLLAGVGALVRSAVGGGILWWTGVEGGWEEGIGGWISWLMSLGSREGWKAMTMT
jgi:lipid intermediate transporter